MTTLVGTATGGTRAWTDPLTWLPNQVPVAADNCQLTAVSGPVTINTGAVARSLDCTGYTGTLTHTAAVNLTLGDATAGAGNVAFKLVAGMTYTLGSTSTSVLAFVSTSATQQTITSAGKVTPSITINGAGSSYIQTDLLNQASASSLFTLSAGTYATAGTAWILGLLLLDGAVAKTLTMGSSAVLIAGSAANTVHTPGTNITFTANTAVITFAGASSQFNSGYNWNGTSLVFSATATSVAFLGAFTVANVTITGVASKTGLYRSFGNPTMTGTFTIAGNSTVNRVLFTSDTIGTVRTITAAAVSLSNVDFQDITAAGAAIPWTGTSMGNALGNSQITFDPSVTQTRNGAGGNYSDLARWTSRVPLPQDNVVIDSGSSGTISADMPRIGRDILFTGGFGGTASFASVANALYGSLALGAGMTISGTQSLTLSARSSKTITSNGKTWTSGVLIVTAPGGTYTLADASLSNSLSITNGTFISAGLPITSGSVAISGTSTTIVDITNSTVTVTLASGFPWNVVNAATVLTATGSTIVYSGASASGRSFGGNGKTYGTLTYTVAGSAGALTITGNNTFNTINFSDANNTRSLLFAAGSSNIFTNWNVNGTAGKLMTLDTSTGAGTFTLSKSSGNAISDYLDVRRSLAGGGATWYAGAHSVDGGSNTGWQFTGIPPVGVLGGVASAAVGSFVLRALNEMVLGGVVTGGVIGAFVLITPISLELDGTVTGPVVGSFIADALAKGEIDGVGAAAFGSFGGEALVKGEIAGVASAAVGSFIAIAPGMLVLAGQTEAVIGSFQSVITVEMILAGVAGAAFGSMAAAGPVTGFSDFSDLMVAYLSEVLS